MPRLVIHPGPFVTDQAAAILTEVVNAVLERLSPSNPSPVFSQGGGYFISDTNQNDTYNAKPFRALLTAVDYTADGFGLYSWTEQLPDVDTGTGHEGAGHGHGAVWADYTGGRSGFAGSAIANPSTPAYEANNNPAQVGTVVQLRRAYFDPTYDWMYTFDYVPGTGSAGTVVSCPLTVVGTTATTNAPVNAFNIDKSSTGTTAANFGITSLVNLSTATVSLRPAYQVDVQVTNATDSVRKFSMTQYIYGTSSIKFFGVANNGTTATNTFYGELVTRDVTGATVLFSAVATTVTVNPSSTFVGQVAGTTMFTFTGTAVTATVGTTSIGVTGTAVTSTVGTTTFTVAGAAITAVVGTNTNTFTGTALTTGMAIVIGTYLTFTEGTHITLSGNTNNLALPTTSFAGISTGTNSYDLTGITAPSGPTAVRLTLRKTDTGTLTLKNNSGSSTAANRFMSVTNADIPLDEDEAVDLTYVPSIPAWMAVPLAGGGSLVSPLTTTGDLWGYDSTDARVPVGADGYALTADSGASLGVSWQPVTATPAGVFGDLNYNAGGVFGVMTGFTFANPVMTFTNGTNVYALNAVSGFQILPSGTPPTAFSPIVTDPSGYLIPDIATYPAAGTTSPVNSITLDAFGRVTNIS